MEQISAEILIPFDVDRQKKLSGRLGSLISAELSPENINTYASNALEGVIEVADIVRQAYGIDASAWCLETENKAFSINRLGNINDILDHITQIDAAITDIDKVIARLEKKDVILVPPDELQSIHTGNGQGIELPGSVPRLKTVLFILQKDFGVDPTDSEHIRIAQGTNSETMMRRQSYTSLDILSLKKLVLVCDEKENVTYVFDTQKLDEVGHTISDIETSTKTQLNNLLVTYPNLGQRIVYSRSFVKGMKAALSMHNSAVVPTAGEQYLIPLAAECDAATPLGLAQRFGVHEKTIRAVIQEMDISMSNYNFGADIKAAVHREDIEAIRQHPMVAMPDASEFDAVSIEYISRNYGRGKTFIEQKIAELGIQTGEFKFGARSRPGKGILKQDLDKLLALPEFGYADGGQSGVVGITELASILDTNIRAVQQVVEELGLELNEYRFGKHISHGFTEKDINALIQHPIFCTPKAGDYGAVSYGELAARYRTSKAKIQEAIDSLDIQTGEYYFGSKIGRGILTSEAAKFDSVEDLTAPDAPEDVTSVNELRKRFVVTRLSFLAAATRQGVAAKRYRFNGSLSEGFTQEEVNVIKQDEKLAAPLAEDYGATSIHEAQLNLHVAKPTLMQAIGALGIFTGEYRFGPNYSAGILATDMQRLEDYLTGYSAI